MQANLNARLHKLLTQCDLMAQKGNLVLSYTRGRSESSRDLTDFEAGELCNWLQTQLPNNGTEAERMNNMRRKIISQAYELGWAVPGEWKTAVERINTFCTGARGKYKKELNKHTYKELVDLTTQFYQMYIKHLKTV